MGGVVLSEAKQVDLSTNFIDPTPATQPYPRTPVPGVDLTDGLLTFRSDHPDFVLQLLDEDGVVYSVTVSSGQTTYALPSWLSGEYELRLYPIGSNLYFYGWIEL